MIKAIRACRIQIILSAVKQLRLDPDGAGITLLIMGLDLDVTHARSEITWQAEYYLYQVGKP
jgi:hypothetical protein